jgi:probable H4MPT-linked C1 transfer pathway protein
MHNAIIGWDVGGAHLKAASIQHGKLVQVLQVPCALWRGLNELERAIDEVLQAFTTQPAVHAITMSGELVDLFTNREAGVKAISQLMQTKLNGVKRFYAGALAADFSAFVTLDAVDQHWQHIASANWLASASFVAQQLARFEHIEYGLLIDIGSTTADFVALVNNQPSCVGLTDAARMQAEELVYTGVIRTPLMALAQKIRFEQHMTALAAEHFATTADVYRLLDELSATDDMADTADGQDKSALASARRLARMVGHDVADAPMSSWLGLAQAFKSAQLERLKNVALMHIKRMTAHQPLPAAGQDVLIIGAGAGSFLAKEIAQQLQLQYVDIAQLIHSDSHDAQNISRWGSVCLPAYAVAQLALTQEFD